MIDTNREVTTYDVIIVYSSYNPNNATDAADLGKFPFSSQGDCDIYNDSYSYFLLQCKKMGLSAAFATSDDIIGPGLFQNFWTYDKEWVRNEGKIFSQVLFDKFTPATVEQENQLQLLTSSESIYMFNNRKITALFQNKLDTFNYFTDFAIPTVEIADPSPEEMMVAKTTLDKLLDKHRHGADFNEWYIIKDITGAGGFNIHKVAFDKPGFKEILENHALGEKNKEGLSYILQPFINCDNGFSFEEHNWPIDIRVILLGTNIMQTYIRIAEEGKFECNIHQGGKLFYISQENMPPEVLEMSKKIVKILDTKIDLKHSLYALDFMQSNDGNVYFIEWNDTPGIIWENENQIDEEKSKELIDIIINELVLIIAKNVG